MGDAWTTYGVEYGLTSSAGIHQAAITVATPTSRGGWGSAAQTSCRVISEEGARAGASHSTASAMFSQQEWPASSSCKLAMAKPLP